MGTLYYHVEPLGENVATIHFNGPCRLRDFLERDGSLRRYQDAIVEIRGVESVSDVGPYSITVAKGGLFGWAGIARRVAAETKMFIGCGQVEEAPPEMAGLVDHAPTYEELIDRAARELGAALTRAMLVAAVAVAGREEIHIDADNVVEEIRSTLAGGGGPR